MFTAQGVVDATPWICDFQTKFLCEIVHGYVFGFKESNGDSYNFLSLSRDLKTQSHCLFTRRFVLVVPDLHLQGHGVAPQHLFIDFRTP